MSVLSSAGHAVASGEDGGRAPLPKKLRGLFAMLFVEIFGASLSIPVFTYFCIVELKLSATYVGVILSCFNAAQLLGAPVVGRVSDAFGRRWALLGCFLWTSLLFLATAGVRTFQELLLVRTLAGLSGGSIPVTQAMVMDCSTPEQRPRILGMMGGLLGLAFTLGPGAVTFLLFLYELNRRLIFVAASCFALLGCLVGVCVLEETLPEHKRRPLCAAPAASLVGGEAPPRDCKTLAEEIWEICSPGLVLIWVGRFCSSFAFLCLFSTYAFLIRDAFSWGDREFGLVLACSGLFGALVQLSVFPAMSKALGKHLVFTVGSALVAVHFVVLPVTTLTNPTVVGHMAANFLFIVGSALMDPGVPDLVGLHAPEDRMGLAQGLTSAFRSLASVLAPLGAGRAYDFSPFLVYLVAASMALVAGGCVGCAPLFGDNTWEKGELESLLKKKGEA